MESAECYRDRDNTLLVVRKKNKIYLTNAELAVSTKYEIRHLGLY